LVLDAAGDKEELSRAIMGRVETLLAPTA
jgi:hypothetical protein